jgi:hypothetical protein
MRPRPLRLAALAAGLVLSLTAPARSLLILRSTFNTPGQAVGVHVEGDLLYVADGFQGGLRIADVSDPGAPVEIGSFAMAGSTNDVRVVGGLAYVANGSAGLRVIDVSDPTDPFQVGSFDTPGSARAVAVAGGLAYVADDSAGLRILDVSDPSAPFEVGSFATPGIAQDVAVNGTLAYVAAGVSGLRVLNVSNPAAPTSVRVYNSPGNAFALDFSGTIVYLADGTGGLHVVDVAPFPVAVLGIFDPPDSGSSIDYALDVDVVGSLAYVSGYPYPSGNTGIVRVIDVSDPPSLVQVDTGHASSGGIDNGLFRGVTVSGPFIFAAGDAGGVRIFATAPECGNGVDDDGDGLVDFPDDPGCLDADADLEDPHCQDGIDNDGQPGTDFDGGESVLGAGNGDPDGPDPQCVGKPWKKKESQAGIGTCGLGFELAPIVAALAWRRRSQARRD